MTIAFRADRPPVAESVLRFRGLVSELIEERNSAIHRLSDFKPFTAWPPMTKGNVVTVRVNWLRDDVTPDALLLERLRQAQRLGATTLEPTELDVRSVPYGTLAAGDPVPSVTVEFLAPGMTITSSGRDLLLPDPELLLRLLEGRWITNTKANPVSLPSDDGELLRRVILKRHELKTVRVSEYLKEGAARGTTRKTATAFVGRATYGIKGPTGASHDAAARRLGALFGLAEYSGLGEGTARGRGAMKVTIDG
jgi:CRISPR-associated endoribonuclease Cas6